MAPALGVSIAIAIFAVVTQSLDATGAISLSTTQQLTMWLVAVGLIVVLWIAYMICSAYVTARTVQAKAEQARAAAEANARLAEAPAVSGSHWKDGSAEEDEDAWIPPDELRHLDGIERSVSTAKMFPHGCYLQPDSISEAEDYDEKTDTDATVVDITRPRAGCTSARWLTRTLRLRTGRTRRWSSWTRSRPCRLGRGIHWWSSRA